MSEQLLTGQNSLRLGTKPIRDILEDTDTFAAFRSFEFPNMIIGIYDLLGLYIDRFSCILLTACNAACEYVLTDVPQ